MASPVSRHHSDFQSVLNAWLGYYAAHTSGCRSGLDGTWRMAANDVPQPDNTLRILPEFGGQSRTEGDYTAGAPELVLEVAASSRARDLGPKLRLYERSGVREYLVAIPGKQELLWKVLTASGFEPLTPGTGGIMRSHFFPGLWLDSQALWNGDQARVFAVLQEGLATPEHAAFAAKLAQSC